jgi:hypothetical protein
MKEILLFIFIDAPGWTGAFQQVILALYGILVTALILWALIDAIRAILFLDVKGVRLLTTEESRELEKKLEGK